MRKQFKYKADVGTKSFNGFRAGIRFSTGQAVFDSDETAETLKAMGFEVTQLIEDEKPKPAPKKATARKKATTKKEG